MQTLDRTTFCLDTDIPKWSTVEKKSFGKKEQEAYEARAARGLMKKIGEEGRKEGQIAITTTYAVTY